MFNWFSNNYKTDENYTDEEGNFNYQKWQEDINSDDREISDRAMYFGQGLVVDSKDWNVNKSQLKDINNMLNSVTNKRAKAREKELAAQKAAAQREREAASENRRQTYSNELEKQNVDMIDEANTLSDKIISRQTDTAVKNAETSAKQAVNLFDNVDITGGGKVGVPLLKDSFAGILNEDDPDYKLKRNILLADHILKSVASLANGIANAADKGNRNTEIDSMLSKYGKANFEQLLKNRGVKEDTKNTAQVSAIQNINDIEQDLNTKGHALSNYEFNSLYERLDNKGKILLNMLKSSDTKNNLTQIVTANLINKVAAGQQIDVISEIMNVLTASLIEDGYTPEAAFKEANKWLSNNLTNYFTRGE